MEKNNLEHIKVSLELFKNYLSTLSALKNTSGFKRIQNFLIILLKD